MIAKTRSRVSAQCDIDSRSAAVLLLASALLSSALWTTQTWAQDKPARVGILSFAAIAHDPNLDTFVKHIRRDLAGHGWSEGNNVAFDLRSADSDASRFAGAAAELVALEVDVILAHGTPALRTAYAATRTIPIVAIDYTSDPVVEGYISSYARPTGNVTGVFLDAPEFAGKWFELLQALLPGLSRVAVLWDPAPGDIHLTAVRGVAESLDIGLQVFEVHKPNDIEAAFSALRGRFQAVVLLPSPLIYGQSSRLAALALKHRLAATSMAPHFATEGGTLAYGPEQTSAYERTAVLLAKILGGNNPAELPAERTARFRLLVNQKTADALGITVPPSILLRADEVIE